MAPRRLAKGALIALVVWTHATALVRQNSAIAETEQQSPGKDRRSSVQEQIAASIKDFGRFTKSLRKIRKFDLLEGLPHQNWEAELKAKEKESKQTIQIAGMDFYAEPVPIKKETATKLIRLITQRKSFGPRRGAAGCGGFHPDWCLAWPNGEEQWYAMLCFGCHELMVFKNEERIIYCVIRDDTGLEKLLGPLRTNRPNTEVE